MILSALGVQSGLVTLLLPLFASTKFCDFWVCDDFAGTNFCDFMTELNFVILRNQLNCEIYWLSKVSV